MGKQLGLGIAQKGRKYIVVGRYRPAGNMTNPGYFERNVTPPKSGGMSINRNPDPKPETDISASLSGGWGNMEPGISMGMDMDMGGCGGGGSVSVETTTING